MKETSATVIDFNAYRARSRAVTKNLRNESRETASEVVPIGFYCFWPVLAWLPVGLLLVPSATEDFA